MKSSDYLFTARVVAARLSVRNPTNDALGIRDVRAMTSDDYGGAPTLAAEGRIFSVACVDADGAAIGRIMSVANAEDLATMKAHYDRDGLSWTATKHGLLLQVDRNMPEKQFRLFESLLETVAHMPANLRADV